MKPGDRVQRVHEPWRDTTHPDPHVGELGTIRERSLLSDAASTWWMVDWDDRPATCCRETVLAPVLTPGGRVRYRRERRYLALGPDSPALASPPVVTEGEGTLHTAFCPLLLRPREWYFVDTLAHGRIVLDPMICDEIEPA